MKTALLAVATWLLAAGCAAFPAKARDQPAAFRPHAIAWRTVTNDEDPYDGSITAEQTHHLFVRFVRTPGKWKPDETFTFKMTLSAPCTFWSIASPEFPPDPHAVFGPAEDTTEVFFQTKAPPPDDADVVFDIEGKSMPGLLAIDVRPKLGPQTSPIPLPSPRMP